MVGDTVSVGTTATLILSTDPVDVGSGQYVAFPAQGDLASLIQSLAANTVDVTLGGSTVTAGGGPALEPGQSLPYSFTGRERVFGITATGSATVAIAVGVAVELE